MDTRGQYTYQEILSQPEAWDRALQEIRKQSDRIKQFLQGTLVERVIFTGCGSTYYLSLAAAVLFQETTGIAAQGLPASEIWLSPQSAFPKGNTLLIAVSRSGETTETLRACETFRNKQIGNLLTISCNPGNPLCALGDVNLVLPSGQEQSVAQTRAFSTLYLATTAIAAIYADQPRLLDDLGRLPEVGRRILRVYATLAQDLGNNRQFERVYFLGSGSRYGLACELNLKMKEMSLSHSEAFHFLEFRHGPQSMVNVETLLVGLLSETNLVYERAVLDQMRQRGARILSLSESGNHSLLENEPEVIFSSGLSETARNVLYLPIGQLLAYHRSMDRGYNPDLPNNLTAVVKLDS